MRIVLIIKIINDDLGTIDLEVWRRGVFQPKTASIQLKNAHQAIGVDCDPSLWSWSGVPLLIDFEDILLRPKRDVDENDFELTSDILVAMATRAWVTRRRMQPGT